MSEVSDEEIISYVKEKIRYSQKVFHTNEFHWVAAYHSGWRAAVAASYRMMRIRHKYPTLWLVVSHVLNRWLHRERVRPMNRPLLTERQRYKLGKLSDYDVSQRLWRQSYMRNLALQERAAVGSGN